jgi:hypothetical protein
MPDELLEKVRADIQKSGFASEMVAAKTFLDAGWGCQPGKSYFDQDEGKTREIDLSLHTSPGKRSIEEILFEYHVLAEVKKSERPWIVFSHDVGAYDKDAWNNPCVVWNLPCNPSEISPILAETSTRRNLPWKGYAVHEAFKDPSQPSRWYSAAVAACKACADNISSEAYSDKTRESWGSGTFLILSNPLVILDGVLIRASLDKEAELQLEYVNLAPLNFEFRTTALKHDSYRLDIVTLAGLPSFIERSNERVKKIYDFICSKRDQQTG